jgi:uncharacterized membrane protein
MTVSPKRHLAKTISYRILSTSIGFITMWLVTGSITVGAAFGLIELVWKPIQYYIHERVWYKHIKFGLTKTKILENKDIVVNSPIDINLEVNTTSPKIKDLVVESPTDIYLEVNTTSPKRLVYTKKTE